MVSSDICENDAYHTQTSDDGQRNKHHQHIFEYLYRNLLRTGKLAVERYVYYRVQKKARKIR